MGGPELFEPFETTMPKQLADTTGFVKAGRRHVEAGPVRCQNGTDVIAMLVEEDQAIILSKFAIANHYLDYVYDLDVKEEISDEYIKIYKDNSTLNKYESDGIVRGCQFEAKISNITRDGLGIVTGPLNNRTEIGPVTGGKGTKVQLEYIGNGCAYCYDDSIKAPNYSQWCRIAPTGLFDGFQFQAEISSIDDSTMGSVSGPNGSQIKIGPIVGEIGQEVKLEYIGNGHAYCHDKAFQAEDYASRLNISAEKYDELSIDKGEVYTGRVLSAHQSHITVKLTESGIHTHIQSTENEEGEIVDVRITGFTHQATTGELVETDISDNGSGGQNRSADSKSGREAEQNGEVDTSKTESNVTEGVTRKTTNESTDKDSSNTRYESEKDTATSKRGEATSTDSDNSSNIDELRKIAIQDAVEEVTNESSAVRQNTATYNRSQAVKEYVKSRADGVCEGCHEPAPFTSKTGEPYLHAHHIHELSDGGSDTPDTVIALCPNCHYRVHHGKDGKKYNKELLRIVQSKENSSA
ncbi:hypothetical protein EXE41_10095 [Halorubrum sp. SD690R]|uniref:HNH endonuclease n=1 Tax=Halorubrum sp. SD690R TaxID=2518117 RepID=UPI0010F517C5|nr:HNH endonuclease [Halorubrum sp. SD690R]TKX46352.1 hypothetical protein EXE41_10095 [Halorubrum sp. SD690R]